MKRREMIIEQKISKVVRNLLMEMAEENNKTDNTSTEEPYIDDEGFEYINDKNDGEPYRINLHSELGNMKDCKLKVYAKSEDEALERAVAYLENLGVYDYFTDKEVEKIWNSPIGEDPDKAFDKIHSLFVEVDGGEFGTKENHFVNRFMLSVDKVNNNEEKVNEEEVETTGNLMLDDEKEDEKFETNSEEVRHKVCDCLSDYGNIRYGFKVMKPEEIEGKIRDCFSDKFDVTVETNEIPKEKFGGDEMKVELTDKNNPDTKYTVYIYQTANDKLRFPGYFKIHNINVLDNSYVTPKEEEPEMDNTEKSLNEAKSLIDRMENLA